mgnify:CR=1 FL=1
MIRLNDIQSVSANKPRRRWPKILLPGIVIVLSATLLRSQLSPDGVARDFKFPDYDRKTNRILSVIMGAQAKQQPDGRIAITSLRIETYEYSDAGRMTNFIVQAPSCVVDMQKRIASSAGIMEAQKTDGLFTITGTGFEWRQKDSHLIISNDVRTTVRRDSVVLRKKTP